MVRMATMTHWTTCWSQTTHDAITSPAAACISTLSNGCCPFTSFSVENFLVHTHPLHYFREQPFKYSFAIFVSIRNNFSYNYFRIDESVVLTHDCCLLFHPFVRFFVMKMFLMRDLQVGNCLKVSGPGRHFNIIGNRNSSSVIVSW